jgi:Cdc6-like AAA superfamily ATPase
MEQNITLYIGDSASGKTRILKQLINKAVSEGHKPVTNMKRYYDANYVPDKNKKSAIIEANTDLTERIVENEIIETDYDSYLSDILRLLYSKGDILILDEIDAMLKTQDIIDLASVLSDNRGLWNKIYINSDYLQI